MGLRSTAATRLANWSRTWSTGKPLSRTAASAGLLEFRRNQCRKLQIARGIQIDWFKDLLREPALLDFLGPRDRDNYVRILQRIVLSAGGGEGCASVDNADPAMITAAAVELEALFTLENLLSMSGALKKRGSLIWRNQTGPMTKDSMRDMSDVSSTALFTSVVVMSVPQDISAHYVRKLGVEQRLQRLGLETSAAPIPQVH